MHNQSPQTAPVTLIPIREVPEFLRGHLGIRKPHVNTIYRWAGGGVRGVRLVTTHVGGHTYVAQADLLAFLKHLNNRRD